MEMRKKVQELRYFIPYIDNLLAQSAKQGIKILYIQFMLKALKKEQKKTLRRITKSNFLKDIKANKAEMEVVG